MKTFMTYQKDRILFEMKLKTPKSHSVFLYYILESCDHLCFYSTLPSSEETTRVVQVQCTIEMKPTLQQVVDGLCDEIDIEVLSEKEVSDG